MFVQGETDNRQHFAHLASC